MRLKQNCLFIAAVFSIAAITVDAQTTSVNSKQPQAANRKKLETDGQNSLEAVNFTGLPAHEHIRNIAAKMIQMKDLRASSWQLARLAEISWDNDSDAARQLFEFALQKVSLQESDAEDVAEQKNTIRIRVFSLIAQRDKVWAEALIDSSLEQSKQHAGLCDGSETNLDVARSLVDNDAKRAAGFGKRSLQNGISPNFITLLQELRQKQPEAADNLFLQALNQYGSQSDDANQLTVLGTYLFTSPRLDSTDGTAFLITRVGNFGVPDLTANRPNIAPNLIRAYLQTAIGAMYKPNDDATQQQAKYALGHLLLPKAQEFAPDLIGEVGAAMAAVGANVPASFTNGDAFANLRKTAAPNRAEAFEDIAKISDESTRDTRYLDIAFHSWRKNDFVTAQTAAAKIKDEKAAASLATLISYGKAQMLLKSKQPNLTEAGQAATLLPQGLERALLHLKIARFAIKTKSNAIANENLNAAAKQANFLDESLRPYFLLDVAAVFAEIDKAQSGTILTDAVKQFNAAGNKAEQSPKWQTSVVIEPLTLDFPLETSASDFEADARNTILAQMSDAPFDALNSEYLRSRALFVSAKIVITAEKAATKKQQESVITVGEDGIRRSANKKVTPAYPEAARRKRIKGTAVVELQYNGKGEVTDAKILESPDAATGQAVIDAVKQWQFTPSQLEGKPISVRGKLTFYFVVSEKGETSVQNPRQYQ